MPILADWCLVIEASAPTGLERPVGPPSGWVRGIVMGVAGPLWAHAVQEGQHPTAPTTRPGQT